jgi:MoaA/NifB/PqqE/SkfB family radical SAM enzyme
MQLRVKKKLGNVILYLGLRKLLKFVPLDLEWANIRVTENCNSKCTTCYAWKNRSINELTTEEMKDALHQLKDVNVKNVIFIGGEPLLRDDIGTLIREASLLQFDSIIVVTNGLLLEKKAEELLKSGVTHITVSVDGVGHTNDIIRGIPGSYEKAIEGIKKIQRLKNNGKISVSVTLLTTILLNQNVDEIPKLIEISKNLKIHWLFNLLDPNLDIFNGIPFSELIVKNEKKIDETIHFLKETRRKHPWLIPTCNHILEYARNYLKGRDRYNFHCIHGYKMVYIGAHGEVWPGCWIMKPIGNLRKDRLHDIIWSKRHKEIVQKMYFTKCSGCTNRYEFNILFKHLVSHKLFCSTK